MTSVFKIGDLIVYRFGSQSRPGLLLNCPRRYGVGDYSGRYDVLVGDKLEQWDESFVVNWCEKLNDTTF